MAIDLILEEGGPLILEEGGNLLLNEGGVGNLLITVEEFLTDLCSDELSDFFIGNRSYLEETRPKILPLMNTGMRQAYAKYKIKYSTAEVSVLSNIATYVLPQTDILAISTIREASGRVLLSSEYSVLGQTLMFAVPRVMTVQVQYKAKPIKFTTDQDDTEVLLELPDLLVDWLRPFVASRYLASMKTEAATAKANDFMLRALEAENFFVQTNTTNEYTPEESTRFNARGFA